jgi:predicted RNA-binding Zn ribbon-like protein
METFVGPRRPLLIVGGNVALDLANTVDEPGLPGVFDHLGHPATVLAWAEQVGLVDSALRAELDQYAARAPDRATVELRRLHRLREAVEDVFGAVADQHEVPESAASVLRRMAGEAMVRAHLEPRGDRMHPVWAIENLADLAHPLAYAAWDLLTTGPLHRIKRCPACPWLYLDKSKNGSRRWCSMEDCGKAVKMARYVAKRAEARRSSAAVG